MAERKFSMDDYVDVAERIQDFKDAHPDGSLQMAPTAIEYHPDGSVKRVEYDASRTVVTIAGKDFIIYRAAAYRTGDDARPGMGIAWEPFPGKTPYTRDSELMNAETAAWGRAIIALGLVANRRLASRQEVRARREDQEAEANGTVLPVDDAPASVESVKADLAASLVDGDTLAQLRDMTSRAKWTPDKLKWSLVELGVENVENLRDAMAGLTLDQAMSLFERLHKELDAAGDDAVPGSGETAA